jgi:hypothetical protein
VPIEPLPLVKLDNLFHDLKHILSVDLEARWGTRIKTLDGTDIRPIGEIQAVSRPLQSNRRKVLGMVA